MIELLTGLLTLMGEREPVVIDLCEMVGTLAPVGLVFAGIAANRRPKTTAP